jgi:hypothetical protein
MSNYYHKPEENKFYIRKDGSYISKVGNFYRAFKADGAVISGVNLPINTGLMSLKGMLPGGIKVFPSKEDIEIEPPLKALL